MIVNDENICIKNLFLDNNNDGNVNITIPIEQTTDWVNLHVIDYLEQNHTIFGDGFILQVYPLNDPLTDYDNVSEVDLSQCEILLKRQYQIPENESLIIVKYDIINSSSITNEVEYSIYDKNGNKLDKIFCNEVKNEIMYPINVNLDINLDYAKEMHIKGIDIYNINDDYFTSLCTTYTKKGLNILSERRNNEYKNISFCSSNCEYKEIDYLTHKVKCECSNDNIIQSKSSFNPDTFFPSALTIIKCYNVYRNPKIL